MNATQISDVGIRRVADLRRADWRFLLPSPQSGFQHLVLLGGPPELPARIVEGGVARCVSVTAPRDGSADAVAVLAGAKVEFSEIAACLAPGGALYYEVDRRSSAHFTTSPGQIQRQLRHAGLTPTGLYWAAPDFVNRRRYIPLDMPGTLRWYLSTLFIAGTLSHRLLEAAILLYTGGQSHRFAGIAPCYAVTAVAGRAQDNGAPSVLGHPALPPELKVPGQRLVMLTSGRSRAVILPFAPGSKEPTVVIKVSRHAGFNHHTEREQVALAEVRAHLTGAMQRTIPRPLGLLRFGELTLGIESFVPGSSLLVTSGRWPTSFQQQVDDLHLAADWLCEFHRQVNIGRIPWGETAIERWIEKPLAAYGEAFGLTSGEERLFTEARTRAKSLLGTMMPLVWMHYDFGPWNLYRHEGEFTVIDWEVGQYRQRERFGPALCDLLYFATYWNHLTQQLYQEDAELQGFHQLFIQADRLDRHSSMARQTIASYMAALDIDPRYLPILLIYTWVDEALVTFDRSQALGEIEPDGRVGNRAVSYIGVMAGHVEQFFAGWDRVVPMPRSRQAFQGEAKP